MQDLSAITDTLRRWEAQLSAFSLPKWEQIPDFGLYMEQVIVLLTQYLNYLPGEGQPEAPITAAAINNYVRTKVMPKPQKKRYYRVHIAYLIMICTLKQGLSLAMLQKMLPPDLSEDALRDLYCEYAQRHQHAAQFLVQQVGQLLERATPEEAMSELLCLFSAMSSFSRLMSEKLLSVGKENDA